MQQHFVASWLPQQTSAGKGSSICCMHDVKVSEQCMQKGNRVSQPANTTESTDNLSHRLILQMICAVSQLFLAYAQTKTLPSAGGHTPGRQSATRELGSN
jgi:hypothetical protein